MRRTLFTNLIWTFGIAYLACTSNVALATKEGDPCTRIIDEAGRALEGDEDREISPLAEGSADEAPSTPGILDRGRTRLTAIATSLLVAAPHLAEAFGDRIGNGGGTSEFILRIFFNRLDQYTNAYLHTLEPSSDEATVVRQLIASNAAGSLDERLIYSEEKFSACVHGGGFVRGGICLGANAGDKNFYLSTERLYAENGNALITSANVVALLSDLLLEKCGYAEDVRQSISNGVQAISSQAWVEAPYNGGELVMLYSRSADSVSREILVTEGAESHRVGDLIEANDPCRKFRGSSLLSVALETPAAAWGSHRTLNLRGIFRCQSGATLSGGLQIQFPSGAAPKLKYLGLD